jgi:hypothetical protein
MRTGTPPPAASVAAEVNVAADDVLQSFRRLADSRILVLQEGSGEILAIA